MLLSDLDILERLTREDKNKIIVSPLIDFKNQIGPSSLDVRLGSDFRIFQSQRYTHIDSFQPKSRVEHDIKLYTSVVQIRPHPKYGGFVLHPGEFVLGSTLEFIALPSDIGARLEGRSSWGRLGLQIHATAGFIDPGFKGVPTLELMNTGKVPIILFVGLRVAQLAFQKLNSRSALPYQKRKGSKYGSKTSVLASLYYEDIEISMLRKQIVDAKKEYCKNVIKNTLNKFNLEDTESNLKILWELIESSW